LRVLLKKRKSNESNNLPKKVTKKEEENEEEEENSNEKVNEVQEKKKITPPKKSIIERFEEHKRNVKGELELELMKAQLRTKRITSVEVFSYDYTKNYFGVTQAIAQYYSKLYKKLSKEQHEEFETFVSNLTGWDLIYTRKYFDYAKKFK